MKLVFTEASLRKYPDINEFLASTPPNKHLLKHALNHKYLLSFGSGLYFECTVWDICCLYGKISHIQHLEMYLSNEEKKAAIKANNYMVIQWIAENGHTEILKHVENHLSDDEKKEAVKTSFYEAVHLSAVNGHTATLKQLETHLSVKEKKELVKEGDYQIYRLTANKGHTATLYHLETHLDENEKKAAVKANGYQAIQDTAKKGYLGTLVYLETHLTADEKKAAVKFKDFHAIQGTARKGHKQTLKHLESHLTEDEKKAAVKAGFFKLIRLAAKNGFTDLIQHFVKHLTGDEKKAALEAKDYQAIRLATKNGYFKTLQYFVEQLTATKKYVVLKKNNYETIRTAAANGHLETLQYLIMQISGKEKKIIPFIYHQTFQTIASNGHTKTLQYLERHLTADEKKEAVKANDYEAVRVTAANGHIGTMMHMEKHLNADEKKAAVKADDYEAMRKAVRSDHMEMLLHLERHLSDDEKKDALKAGEYEVIRRIAMNGHTRTLQRMEMHLTEDEKIAVIQANNYTVIQATAINGYSETLEYYLNTETGLAYAEAHDREYGANYIYPFVSKKIAQIKDKKALFKQKNTEVLFDLEDNESRIYFYILRNLIRRGVNRDYSSAEYDTRAEILDEELDLLLNIPRLSALCHQSLNQGPENELLRFALHIGNQAAVNRLLNIEAVRSIAEQNNFYQEEAHQGIDIRELAQDRESSMRALTPGEQNRLAKAISAYQPIIDERGLGIIMEELRNELINRYKKSPAYIEINNESFKLPYDYASFKALNLKEEHQKEACKAYYQHKDHTTWRYISKPNPWMSSSANCINMNDGGTASWSTFEDYQSLICLCYLAVKDENQPPTEGHSFESRLSHFVDELALIGRAHNWDKSRERIIEQKEVISEEYDDLEGDKPSCFSGVKRRLFQSVSGHPFFQVLTLDKLIQELRSFVRKHFLTLIKQQSLEYKTAYEEYILMLNEKALNLLKTLDIPKEKQISFMKAMSEKYGDALNDDPVLRHYLMTKLLLKHGEAHAITLGGLADLENLFKKTAFSSLNANGMFQPTTASLPKQEEAKEEEILHRPK